RLVSEGGKPLTYVATLETELGDIAITMRGDVAPNHVRNFVALIQAGYYDGLVFERTILQVNANDPADRLQMIEGGCPVGTGDIRYNSIGYWLKPEFNDRVKHEEGSVGASHGEEPDTAACQFYITLSKAPLLDGQYTVFGKVSRGLDVAHKIFQQPTIKN